MVYETLADRMSNYHANVTHNSKDLYRPSPFIIDIDPVSVITVYTESDPERVS